MLLPEMFVGEPADGELTPCEGEEQATIFGGEEVEATIFSVVFGDRASNAIELVGTCRGIGQRTKKLEVAPIGGQQALL